MIFKKLKFYLSFLILCGACVTSTEDTGSFDLDINDEFVNNWWSLETDNALLNPFISSESCYRFYEFTSESYGDYRKLYGRDSIAEGSYFVADWKRINSNVIIISDKYELVYEKNQNGCYLLWAYSSLLSAEGEACRCEEQ